jgi:NAD(P)-dependent dehydrogenase (short-subunit alcohol dehydrogenase family)
VAEQFGGKSVVVTGAASGMGRAIAAAFAAAGASVTAADINAAGGEETVAAIIAGGGTAQFVATDVADAIAVEALVAQSVTAYGDLHCAVNAAAIEGESMPLDQLDDELFDRVQHINVRSVFLCMKHELKAMMAAGTGGAIVNIASTNSFRPQPRQSAYTASKFAVLGLTKSAAIDAMARRKNGDEAATIARLSLIGRFGLVDEIAKAALWLCSDDASFTMGHALAVDGGYLAR